MKHSDVVKRDELLADYMRQHRGKSNFVTGREAAKFLSGAGYPCGEGSIGCFMCRLRKQYKLPILFAKGRGYYWAREVGEVLDTIKQLNSAIGEMQGTINLLLEITLDGGKSDSQ